MQPYTCFPHAPLHLQSSCSTTASRPQHATQLQGFLWTDTELFTLLQSSDFTLKDGKRPTFQKLLRADLLKDIVWAETIEERLWENEWKEKTWKSNVYLKKKLSQIKYLLLSFSVLIYCTLSKSCWKQLFSRSDVSLLSSPVYIHLFISTPSTAQRWRMWGILHFMGGRP